MPQSHLALSVIWIRTGFRGIVINSCWKASAETWSLCCVPICKPESTLCWQQIEALQNHISWGEAFRDSRSARINTPRQSIPTAGWAHTIKKCQDLNKSAIYNQDISKNSHMFVFLKVSVYMKLKGTRAGVWFELQPKPYWAESYTPHWAAYCWPTHRCSKRQLLLNVLILRAVGISSHPKSLALSACHLSPAKS